MNAPNRLVSLMALILICAGCATSGKSASRSAPLPVVGKVSPGESAPPAKVHATVRQRVLFSAAPAYPATVSLCSLNGSVIAHVEVADDQPFKLEADVQPGSYLLRSDLISDAAKSKYAARATIWIHIDRAGTVRIPSQVNEELSHLQNIAGMTPADSKPAETVRPVLKWSPVAGATHYKGQYISADRHKWFDVQEPTYTIQRDVEPGEGFVWIVSAVGAEEKVLAEGTAYFYAHGTAPEASVAQTLQDVAGCCGEAILSAGSGYLGIMTMPDFTPKKPDGKPIDKKAGRTMVPGESIPALTITAILPGSPAADADLLPDDMIIAIDGRPIAEDGRSVGSQADFLTMIRSKRAGSTLTLTVRRDGNDVDVRTKLGKGDMAAGALSKPAAPETTDDPAVVEDAAPTTQTREQIAAFVGWKWAWSKVKAGSPLITPFKAPAGDSTRITSVDGLPADVVSSIAELPGGAIAFGTASGLSIWDGTAIRTYTGRYYSTSEGGMAAGNSGLPSNDVHDLLCDSKGRLWVATSEGVCRIELGKGDDLNAATWRVLGALRGWFGKEAPEGIADVQRLFQMSDGTVVLGSRHAGVTLVDPKSDATRIIYKDDNQNHWVAGMGEDAQHRLWIAVLGVGVLRYDGTAVTQIGPVQKESEEEGAVLRGLCIDSGGTVWLGDGMSGGLTRIDVNDKFQPVPKDSAGPSEIWQMSTDREGRIWVVTMRDVFVRDHDKWKYPDLGDFAPETGCAFESRDGSWWFGGREGVLHRAKLTFNEESPQTARIKKLKQEIEGQYPNVKPTPAVATGAGGRVVVATEDQLLRFDGKSWEDLTSLLERSDAQIVLADSKGNVCVGTNEAGVIRLDADGKVRRFNNDKDDGKCVTYAMTMATDGTIYIGTQRGVYRLRDDKSELLKTDQAVWQVGSVVIDGRGHLWAGELTNSTIFMYDGHDFIDMKATSPMSESAVDIQTLRTDDAGRVLVDLAAQPGKPIQKTTYRWDTAADGKIPTATKVE